MHWSIIIDVKTLKFIKNGEVTLCYKLNKFLKTSASPLKIENTVITIDAEGPTNMCTVTRTLSCADLEE